VELGEQKIELNGNDLLDTAWNAMYDSTSIRFLPMLISQVNQGNTEVWKRLLSSNAGTGVEETAWGMHYSVDCAERWSFQDRQDFVQASQGLRPEISEAVVDYFDDSFWICKQWDVPQAPASIHTPVQSAIPTLLLSGEFDPGTPPAFADMAAETLTHHYTVVFPYLGHTDGFSSPCHASIVSGFLDDPSHPPDMACITEMDKPPFVLK
jgi:pimeloyl-ACP methyl ester carboxylesterase